MILPADVLKHLPVPCFWKDAKSVYLGSNLAGLDFIKLSSEILIGMTDHDSPWKNIADKNVDEDQFVLKGNEHYNLDYITRGDGTKQYLLVKKGPLLSKNGCRTIGVTGIGFHLDRKNFKSIMHSLGSFSLKFSDFISQKNKSKEDFIYGDICFSKIKARVISEILRGKTAPIIADTLFLSHRTIEKHTDNIKIKLKCNSKTELPDKAFEHGFIDLMFMKN